MRKKEGASAYPRLTFGSVFDQKPNQKIIKKRSPNNMELDAKGIPN